MSTEKNDNQKTATVKAVRDLVADHTTWVPDEQTKVLEIRTGEVQRIEYPVKVSIKGVPSAPAEFYKKRIRKENLHDPNKCHLIVDREVGIIYLFVDENYEKGHLISGAIKDNKHLQDFRINDDTMYNSSDLAKLLKINKIWFTDPQQCGQMVHNLQHFEGEWTTKIRNVDNQKGITCASIERELKKGIPLSFTLTIEPYKGFEKRTFNVDICINYQGSNIEFYLESIELMQIQFEMKLAEIQKQIAEFNDEICIFEV